MPAPSFGRNPGTVRPHKYEAKLALGEIAAQNLRTYRPIVFATHCDLPSGSLSPGVPLATIIDDGRRAMNRHYILRDNPQGFLAAKCPG